MRSILLLFLLSSILGHLPAAAAEKSIKVFIALCDNKTQGIIPVGAKIGDGDNPDANLYWGCTDGFGAYFKKSPDWKVTGSLTDVSPTILRRMTLQHRTQEASITADAYRGSAMRACIEDFEMAVSSGSYDLVAFIGHNGLMDFTLSDPPPGTPDKTDAIVLCCKSDKYFRPRLTQQRSRPVLLTQELMYPGSFILHSALRVWLRGGTPAEMRTAAAQAYAKNQNISVRAATGVFAKIE